MFYLLSKTYLHIQECVIEADSFEEAKEKAKTSDGWYWREEFLGYEGYRMGEDEEEIYDEDYVKLDGIEF